MTLLGAKRTAASPPDIRPSSLDWCTSTGFLVMLTLQGTSRQMGKQRKGLVYPVDQSHSRKICLDSLDRKKDSGGNFNHTGIRMHLNNTRIFPLAEINGPMNYTSQKSTSCAAWTGHGDSIHYHEYFGYKDTGMECLCGCLKTSYHSFQCRDGCNASLHH